MINSRRLLGLGASAAIIFAACGQGTPTTAPTVTTPPVATAGPTAGPTTAPITYKACVAYDTGGLGDKGFNDLAQKGLKDAEKAGYQIAEAEAKDSTDYAANIQRLIDQGCQTIVTVGFNYGQATAEKVLANPTIAFGQVDTTWAGGPGAGPDFTPGTADDIPVPPNFTGLDYQIDQAGMLAGYLAAGWTKTGKIGTYGGQPFAGVTRFMDGLYAGIARYNEKHATTDCAADAWAAGCKVVLLGWDGDGNGSFVGGSNPWNDPAKGAQLAQALVDQGVDIVHPVSGATGNGSILYMSQQHLYAIGVDTDQYESLGTAGGNSALLTSAQKAIDVSVLDLINKNYGGDLGGEDYSGTLRNAGVLLAPYHDYDSQFSAELKAEVEEFRQGIFDGVFSTCDYLPAGC